MNIDVYVMCIATRELANLNQVIPWTQLIQLSERQAWRWNDARVPLAHQAKTPDRSSNWDLILRGFRDNRAGFTSSTQSIWRYMRLSGMVWHLLNCCTRSSGCLNSDCRGNVSISPAQRWLWLFEHVWSFFLHDVSQVSKIFIHEVCWTNSRQKM